MRPSPMRLLPAAAAAMMLTMARPAMAQTDTTAVPQPPTARLAALAKFFGSYIHTDQHFAGAGPFYGTMEVGPTIKGWYVEWVIDTRFGPIDRELRLLVTWDEDLGRYRIWPFDTTPPYAPGTLEAEGRLVDGEFVVEWKRATNPWGKPGTRRDIFRMEGDEQIIVADWVPNDGGEITTLSEWRSRRVSRAR